VNRHITWLLAAILPVFGLRILIADCNFTCVFVSGCFYTFIFCVITANAVSNRSLAYRTNYMRVLFARTVELSNNRLTWMLCFQLTLSPAAAWHAVCVCVCVCLQDMLTCLDDNGLPKVHIKPLFFFVPSLHSPFAIIKLGIERVQACTR